MDARTTYLLAPHVLAQFDLDEAVLLDELRGSYFSANPVASLILRQCRESVGRDALLMAMLEQFRIDAVRAAADLDRFLDDAVRHGVLHRSESGRA